MRNTPHFHSRLAVTIVATLAACAATTAGGCVSPKPNAHGQGTDAGAGTDAGTDAGAGTDADTDAGAADCSRELDILFLVDNSASMSEEQEALKLEIPRLVSVLATGDRGTGDTADNFDPVDSIHVGVITSDLGVYGVPIASGARCDTTLGDDGLLLTEARGGDVSCDASYPQFLVFDPTSTEPDEYTAAGDFSGAVGCVADTGADGCSFEQQLDAILKSLTPSTSALRFGAVQGTEPPIPALTGHGDGVNAGFLRPNSILAIVAVTDEDDCSTSDADLFDVAVSGGVGTGQYPVPTVGGQAAPSIQCPTYRSVNYPISRYVNGLFALRPGLESKLIFATIAGVDPALLEANTSVRLRNGYALFGYDYTTILADTSMTERVDSTGRDLEPACVRPSPSDPTNAAADNLAYPARRMLQVTRGVDDGGGTGVVASICTAADPDNSDYDADFSDATDAIIVAIAAALPPSSCDTP